MSTPPGNPTAAAAEWLALPVWPDDPLTQIRTLGVDTMVIALDDDPTGTQTVRDVPVVTQWSVEALRQLLDSPDPLAFLLTNSRSLPGEQAAALATSIGHDLRAAGTDARRGWTVISRSDSTLRGHFPVEVDALVDALGIGDARVVLAPFFGDGGRVTLDGIHYLRRDDRLVPVAETEFARDAVFGYRSSDLRAWVAERAATVPGSRTRQVSVMTLDRIRGDGPTAVRDALCALPPAGVLAVDAALERDIEVVALGALLAERQGLPLVGRTAASYVRARAGRAPVQPLALDEVRFGQPGLIVVGSHVPMTTTQLERLLADPPIPMLHLDLPVGELLAATDEECGQRLASVGAEAETAIRNGLTPVVATSRELMRGADAAGDLAISALVSAALVAIVRDISIRPAWILSKGGITSSDVATRALDVDEALILGPLLAGVPLWRCGPRSRWPGLPLAVFPGNVGGPDAVRDAVDRLAGGRA